MMQDRDRSESGQVENRPKKSGKTAGFLMNPLIKLIDWIARGREKTPICKD
jgi:hypothetical protein